MAGVTKLLRLLFCVGSQIVVAPWFAVTAEHARSFAAGSHGRLRELAAVAMERWWPAAFLDLDQGMMAVTVDCGDEREENDRTEFMTATTKYPFGEPTVTNSDDENGLSELRLWCVEGVTGGNAANTPTGFSTTAIAAAEGFLMPNLKVTETDDDYDKGWRTVNIILVI
nr:hypothetical protein Iba_chr07cCG5200 [Ipomoea batatas]